MVTHRADVLQKSRGTVHAIDRDDNVASQAGCVSGPARDDDG
jgi:hypothetical protein